MRRFWKWYNDNKTLNLGIAAFLFGLQIVHLIWLFGDVVYFKVSGTKIFNLLWLAWVAILIDFLELPVIYDTFAKFLASIKKGKVKQAFEVLKDN